MNKYYKILGLEEGASKEEIQQAYQKLSNDLDPSKNDNLDFFVEEYKKVQEAFKKLNLYHESIEKITVEKLEEDKEIESNKSDDLSKIDESKDPQTKQNNRVKSGENKSHFYNKIMIGSLVVVVVFFGITYLVFLNKINNFQNSIPLLTSQSKEIQNNSREFWENKFFKDHPEIVNKHLTDNTNKGFLYDENDRTRTKDSIITFMIYSKTLSYDIYTPDFFECVYYDAVNSDIFWNHYIVGLDDKKRNQKPLPLYLEMQKRIKQKYGLEEKEFEGLIDMAGGLSVFHLAKETEFDIKCKKCIDNYQVTYVTNSTAINDFYDFTEEYLKIKKDTENKNRIFLKRYNESFNKITFGISQALKNQLKSRLDKENFPKKSGEINTFFGSTEGIDKINYSLERYDENLSLLDKYADETFKTFYSTNSLSTGSTPYRACYGRNPYCSPPYGYAECSYIDVRNSNSSDVVVIVKKNNIVYSHAYIKAGGYHKFKLGNGSFQTFFYYGNGWNPNKFIKNTSCGKIIGGFVSDESLDKDNIINLRNSSITYTLYSVEGGNFSPKSSNKNEAF